MKGTGSQKPPDSIRHTETPQELAQRWSVPLSWVYGQTRRRGPDAIPMLKVGKYNREEAEAAGRD